MMKRLKKMISIVMAVIVIATGFTIPVSASSGYTDVSTSDSCYNAVIYLRDHNIMVGQTSTYFGKNNTLIRADVVSILWRMLNMPEPYGMISSFPDCDPNAYYYKAVQWACSESVGIASGYENGNFGPTDLVSNQDLLTFIYRFACYCGYTVNNSANQNNYLNKFNDSELIYKNTFWDYSKVPVGWAVYTGFISDITMKGTAIATRGNTAKYVYHFYQRFQRKYGLMVINSLKLTASSGYTTAMSEVFNHHNIRNYDIHDNIEWDYFDDVMRNAFGEANKLDLCYLYISAHGRETPGGIDLFKGNTDDWTVYLTPSRLRSEIEIFDGTFIVFLETCYSGNFILESTNVANIALTEVELNAKANDFIHAFVNELVGIPQDDSNISVQNYNLAESERLKVIGSSRYFEISQSGSAAATYMWKEGAGPHMTADFNYDNRISLHELYYHTNYMMSINPSTSLPVCYPENDHSIIFENHF